MDTIRVIFVIVAIMNILFAIIRWIDRGEEQFSAIAGWFCAILYCIG